MVQTHKMSKKSRSISPNSVGTPITGAQLAARALKAHGVARVFALCGDHVNALFHAVENEGIEIVGARHESAAVQMADGWARATGLPGVVIVTGGPGHTNAVTGVAVAQGAQSPVVLISGQAAKKLRERGGNQSLYQADLMRPVTKWSIEAETPESTGELISRALSIAVSGTPGSVSVSIPVDVAKSTRDFVPAATGQQCQAGQYAATVPISSATRAAKLLAAARRPVAIIGGNAWCHGSHKAIARALRALGIPAFTNGQSRGVIPDDGKFCFGYANPLFNRTFRAVADADLFLLIGSTLDYSFGSGTNRVVNPGASIVQVHQDPFQIGVGQTPHAAIVGDHASALRALESALAGSGLSTYLKRWRRELRQQYIEQQAYWQQLTRRSRNGSGGIHPAAVCKALQKHWTPNTTMVFDVGDFTNWPKAYFPAQLPARFMDGGALGNLGGALPLAIGAQIAAGSSSVWAFTGDGGFGFHGWELSTAVERDLPLKIILGNDNCWGTEKRLQRMEFGRDIACDLPAIRYDKFAHLLGVSAFHAATETELTRAIDRFAASRGPSLLQIDLAPLAGRPFQIPAARA